jgi:hypothetical protein
MGAFVKNRKFARKILSIIAVIQEFKDQIDISADVMLKFSQIVTSLLSERVTSFPTRTVEKI